MAKKVKPEIVYVKCRNCKNASDFGDNSAYCRAKGHRVCACDVAIGKYNKMHINLKEWTAGSYACLVRQTCDEIDELNRKKK